MIATGKCLECAAQSLLALNRFKQGLEVAFAETLGTFAVNDFVKQRRAVGDWLGKDLQQIPFVIAVDENAEFAERIDVLVDLAHTIRQHVVVGFGNLEEFDPTGLQPTHRVNNVIGEQSNVLDSRSAEEFKEFIDLRLLFAFGRFVDREFDAAITRGHNLGHKRGVFGANVVVVEAEHIRKAQNVFVPLDPGVHLAEFDVANTVVDFEQTDRIARHVEGLESWVEIAFELIAIDEAVDDISVGSDRGVSNAAFGTFMPVRFAVGDRPSLDRRLKCPVYVVDFESDVLYKVAVLGNQRGHRVAGSDRSTEYETDIVLFQNVIDLVFGTGFESPVSGDRKTERVLIKEGRLTGVVHVVTYVIDAADGKSVRTHIF